ncbi:MOSC domain-containing protein [Nakamurella leprariae]|uniref:MOSC domain-containing protein n=1 Tax=Nakamurella leprariae TaxID=2803911 RepID=A0A938YFS8_9ACTN|nr:MOSC domain-containing protein [Nakamurella leprariae]MBM9468778.1 MOSC domain-containing protein [Nakamurella leprariae]
MVDAVLSAARLDVVSVGFAPVKGTRHLPQPSAEFDTDGPIGDRAYCLVDVERREVLKTIRNPTLIAVVARETDNGLEVVLPSGESAVGVPSPTGDQVTCEYWGRPVPLKLTDGPHADLFSRYLGRAVRFARAPRGGVVFGDQVTVVTTASLRDLGSRVDVPDLVAEAGRFRATFVVETDEPYAEESWLGREMTVGSVRLRISIPIPRCGVIDLDPNTGERHGRLLKTLAGYRPVNRAGEPMFGVYARVVGEA